jgi:hypothetical protein
MGLCELVRYRPRFFGKPSKNTEFIRCIRFSGTRNQTGIEFLRFGIFHFGFRYFSVRFRFSVFRAQGYYEVLVQKRLS